MKTTTVGATTPEYSGIRTAPQAIRAAGHDGHAGTRIRIVGESLCEAADLRWSDSLPDVAAGNRNAPPAAPRRGASSRTAVLHRSGGNDA